MRYLIAEDETAVREVMRGFLAEHAEISTACNGREALRAFTDALQEKRPFDAVLLDIVMPQMDGRLCLKLMRLAETKLCQGQSRKTNIIVTSKLGSPADMQQLFWEGDCTDYLVKPVVRDDLTAMLRRYGLAG